MEVEPELDEQDEKDEPNYYDYDYDYLKYIKEKHPRDPTRRKFLLHLSKHHKDKSAVKIKGEAEHLHPYLYIHPDGPTRPEFTVHLSIHHKDKSAVKHLRSVVKSVVERSVVKSVVERSVVKSVVEVKPDGPSVKPDGPSASAAPSTDEDKAPTGASFQNQNVENFKKKFMEAKENTKQIRKLESERKPFGFKLWEKQKDEDLDNTKKEYTEEEIRQMQQMQEGYEKRMNEGMKRQKEFGYVRKLRKLNTSLDDMTPRQRIIYRIIELEDELFELNKNGFKPENAERIRMINYEMKGLMRALESTPEVPGDYHYKKNT
jgi:hypothetical protein